MSPLTREGAESAAHFVHANWPLDPGASKAFAAQLRHNGDVLTASAVDDDDRRKAAAITLAADAAESAVAELEGACA